jgi:hypothetical protein
MKDERTQRAIETAERFADGLVAEQLREATMLQAHHAEYGMSPARKDTDEGCAAFLATHVVDDDGYFDKRGTMLCLFAHDAALARSFNNKKRRGDDAKYRAEAQAQAVILRDIAGNPFRPLSPHPEAIPPLAEQIYAGAWDKMPLLGAWLQEHGYQQEAEHCLDPSIQHVKGCWVVDWLTGRE